MSVGAGDRRASDGGDAGADRTVASGLDAGPAGADGSAALTRDLDAAIDAEAAFTGLFSAAPVAFWLDGTSPSPEGTRRSLLGDGSGPLAHVLRHDAGSGSTTLVRTGGVDELPGDVLDVLGARLAAAGGTDDVLGGYIGYLGYEIGVECGAADSGRAAHPDAQWLFVDRVLTVDHDRGRARLAALTDGSEQVTAAQEAWLSATAARLTGRPCAGGPATSPRMPTPPAAEPHVHDDLADPADPPARDGGLVGEIRAAAPEPVCGDADVLDPRAVEPHLVRDRARYLDDVRSCLAALRAGESYEICLTNAVELPAPDDPLAFYRRLRRSNPAPYAAYLRFDDLVVASSSPERFLRVAQGVVESRPIKGTAPRGATPQEDVAIRDALAADPKTRAENLMIVDLLRNDLSRVCEVGTVATHGLMAIESYATVHQMVTTIRGRLRAGLDSVDAIRACFPAGSMTGAPKRRTTELCAALEGTSRGVYSGALGRLGADGSADLSVVIRTAVLHGRRCRIGAGGAIVLDSDPVDEYDEMLLKATSTLRAHPCFDGSVGT